MCRVPEECPEEVEAVINNCRRLDPNERPTALEVCSVIENSAPRRSESGNSGMHEGEPASIFSALEWPGLTLLPSGPGLPAETASDVSPMPC